MDVLETLYGTPAGKFVARKAGLADPPTLRRGRVITEVSSPPSSAPLSA